MAPSNYTTENAHVWNGYPPMRITLRMISAGAILMSSFEHATRQRRTESASIYEPFVTILAPSQVSTVEAIIG